MKENRTPNYGLDAPPAVRTLLIVGALGLSRSDGGLTIFRPGLFCVGSIRARFS